MTRFINVGASVILFTFILNYKYITKTSLSTIFLRDVFYIK